MCSPQTILDKIVEKIVDTVIQLIVCHIRYVCCYKGNLEKLDVEKKNLEVQRQNVNDEVDRYKTLGEDIEANVSNWLTEVDKMIKEVEEFVNHKTAKESMQCSKFSCPDYISRYKLSKQAERKIGDMANLTQKGNFDKVSHPRPPPQELLLSSSAELVSMDYMSFNSRKSVFNRIMDELKGLNACKIGVHGPGGVGKTKMVEEVSKQVIKDGLFDEVVMAVVSQDDNVSKIQLQLVEGLNPKPDVVTITDDRERAKKLWHRLDNGKKNLIILDDIWHELNLTTIGIPIKDRNKVVITSRNRDVWKNMEMDTEIQINVLSEPEAWALFKKKVADSVDSDQELYNIAKKVCKECQGLPVAILAVGGALKGEEKYVWKNALDKLKKSMLKTIKGINPKVYASLKLSYDSLSKDAKSCFLLCCMFPEDAKIPIDELVRHCMARGLLDQKPDTLEEARDAVRTVVDELKTCSLLLDGTDKNIVKMHDVIRDVAVSVADDEKAILVKHGVHEWPRKGTYESYSAISLRFKTIHEVPDKLGCPQLHILLLEGIYPLFILPNRYFGETEKLIIPDMFFSGTEKLTVLELNRVCMLQLPPSLANLVNLRMFCLNACLLEDITILKDLKNNLEILSLRGSSIKVLPSEIGQLTRLRLLDLSDCYKLRKIPQGVISNLSRLGELYILNSFEQWEDPTVSNERSNASLDELRKLTQLTTLHIHIPDAMLLPKDICFENLIRFIISMGKSFDHFEYQSSTRMFKLVGVPLRDKFNVLLERAEVLYLEEVKGLQKLYHGLYPLGSFNKLTELTIEDCTWKYLFSPSCARGLLQIQRLVIRGCYFMEGIVGNEGEKNKEAVTSEAINFSQLKYMKLESLPRLVSFYPKMEKTTTAKKNSFTPKWLRRPVISLFNEKVTFLALETLYIAGLRKITEIWDMKLLPSESFRQLRHVMIRNCKELVKVIELENGKEEEKAENNDNTISFAQLTILALLDLQSLRSFCTSRSKTQSLFTSQVSFPKLEILFLDNCVKSREIHPWNVQAGKVSLKFLDVANLDALIVRNSSTVTEVFQLEELNVGEGQHVRPLIEVRRMELDRLPQLTCLWNKDPHGIVGLQSLQYLTIKKCSLLRNLFTCSTAMALQQLKVLYLESCPMMEEVIATTEDVHKEVIDNVIEFPKLEWLILKDLPNLNNFCNANYNFNLPSLQRIVLKRCSKMHNFTFGQVHMPQILVSTRGNEGLQTKDLNKYLKERLLKGEECATVDETDYDGDEILFSEIFDDCDIETLFSQFPRNWEPAAEVIINRRKESSQLARTLQKFRNRDR